MMEVMTTEEIVEKIEVLERRRFYIEMTDRWTMRDRLMLMDVERELAELKAILK